MSENKNIRIVDIARMAGVSAGTVDRVLHNRGRVSEKNKKQVEQVLKEINYTPNMLARFLVSNKSFTFAVVIPSFEKGEYWELIHMGIEKAISELKDFHVKVDYIYFDQFDSNSLSKRIREIPKQEYDGVVIATLYKDLVKKLSLDLDTIETPYIFIDSNISGLNNVAYFGADSAASGTIAARLMLTQVGTNGNIIIANSQNKAKTLSTQIEKRKQGFLTYLNENNFDGNINYIDFGGSNSTDIERLKHLLRQKGNKGLVVLNSRVYELLNIMSQEKIGDNISIIGYDSIGKNVELLKSGQILYLISQRSILQGYESIKALSNLLIFNIIPTKENYMSIDILIKENIGFYNN